MYILKRVNIFNINISCRTFSKNIISLYYETLVLHHFCLWYAITCGNLQKGFKRVFKRRILIDIFPLLELNCQDKYHIPIINRKNEEKKKTKGRFYPFILS